MESKALDNLYKLHLEHKLAHAYLIETNNIENCYENIVKLCKKLFCENEYCDNCNKCSICSLIDKKNLPNFIVVEPNGKSIKKAQIDALKKQCSTIPLFVNKNIYVIKEAEKMNDTVYNKMLKFLEEPEENIIGFYLTESKDNIPSTILSRLEIIKDLYEINYNELLNPELKEAADKYISMLENSDKNLVWYNINVLTDLLKERTDYNNFFKYILEKYKTNKCMKNDNYIKKIKLISKYLEELNYNVNGKLLLDSFAIEMSDING